jgi:hypothetical protein
MKHIRKALLAILVLLVTLPCVTSGIASTRYTGYLNKDTYVYQRASKSSKKLKYPRNTKVYVIGTSGKFYKVQNPKNSAKGYVLKSCISKTKTSDPANPTDDPEDQVDPVDPEEPDNPGDSMAWKSKVVKLDWYKKGKNVLKRGGYAYLYDIKKGIKLRIKRMGGTNHADVEPATASDTAKLKKLAGGKFSWVCHPVILQANGQYVACSINTMPHGDQTIRNNNYNGQFCLHMVNSRTHGSDKVDPDHQAAVAKAAGR